MASKFDSKKESVSQRVSQSIYDDDDDDDDDDDNSIRRRMYNKCNRTTRRFASGEGKRPSI
jgi:hypothetical protein